MAPYRYQVVSVGFWRGKIKRWNTTFHLATSDRTDTLRAAMQSVGWKNPGDVAGACSGGVASIAIYASTGGVPVSNTIYFDWKTPSTWIPYNSGAWDGVPPETLLDASAESAAIIVGPMDALSATGKPVQTKKYLHAVPSRTAVAYSDPDIAPAIAAALALKFPSYMMLNPAGVAPATVKCLPYYGNHQRVRGRRRTVAVVAAQSFTAGVVTGAGATGSGAQPFRG